MPRGRRLSARPAPVPRGPGPGRSPDVPTAGRATALDRPRRSPAGSTARTACRGRRGDRPLPGSRRPMRRSRPGDRDDRSPWCRSPLCQPTGPAECRLELDPEPVRSTGAVEPAVQPLSPSRLWPVPADEPAGDRPADVAERPRPRRSAQAPAASPARRAPRPRGTGAASASAVHRPGPGRVLAVLLALVGGGATALAMDKTVTVTVDGQDRVLHTYADDVAGTLAAAGHRAGRAGPGRAGAAHRRRRRRPHHRAARPACSPWSRAAPSARCGPPPARSARRWPDSGVQADPAADVRRPGRSHPARPACRWSCACRARSR